MIHTYVFNEEVEPWSCFFFSCKLTVHRTFISSSFSRGPWSTFTAHTCKRVGSSNPKEPGEHAQFGKFIIATVEEIICCRSEKTVARL